MMMLLRLLRTGQYGIAEQGRHGGAGIAGRQPFSLNLREPINRA
jgi:hypothetical protein